MALSMVRDRLFARCRGYFFSTRPYSSHPVSVKASSFEVGNGQLNERNLEIAVRHLHQDGLIVVEDAIPHAKLNQLNQKMVEDARYLQSLGDKGLFVYSFKRPLFSPLF